MFAFSLGSTIVLFCLLASPALSQTSPEAIRGLRDELLSLLRDVGNDQVDGEIDALVLRTEQSANQLDQHYRSRIPPVFQGVRPKPDIATFIEYGNQHEQFINTQLAAPRQRVEERVRRLDKVHDYTLKAETAALEASALLRRTGFPEESYRMLNLAEVSIPSIRESLSKARNSIAEYGKRLENYEAVERIKLNNFRSWFQKPGCDNPIGKMRPPGCPNRNSRSPNAPSVGLDGGSVGTPTAR